MFFSYRRFLALVTALLIASSPLRAQELEKILPPLPKGPLLLTSATPEMQKPDFWINRLQDPDKLLKTDEQVEVFNREIETFSNDRKDVFKIGNTISSKETKALIKNEYEAIAGRKLFDKNDKYIPKTFFTETIKPNLRLDAIPDKIKVRWAAAVKHASVRVIPTDKGMLEEKGDVEFDMVQNTKFKTWTPMAVYHTTKDGEWAYVQGTYARGWIKSRDIAIFETKEKLKSYVERKRDFLVVTGLDIPVFSNPGLTEVRAVAQMGTRLPLQGETGNYFESLLPVRGQGGAVVLEKILVSKASDVSKGRLPYTQRNIIRQAFKLLGARYGWGGFYDGRDCSGFTFDVFMSMGLDMPRNSKEQGVIGTFLNGFEPFKSEQQKIATLAIAKEGITLIRMPSHIMLYLGQINGLHYVIHSTWAERYSMTDDSKNRINQTVVSDLTLNGKSRVGSLFHRIVSINEVN
ncbi:MAG TPA: hypothetical protein DIS66_06510 [Candidatus Omnitrophica bacterium]|nr:hypothetical protein [Candidatus Omnitrophota bacterium]